jgi:LacI family transcriptional regulator
MGERSRSELLAELIAYENAGGRVTMVSQPDLPFRTVEIGNRAGAAALADQLIELGYRSAAILTGLRDLRTARERTLGFRRALRCSWTPDSQPMPAARGLHSGWLLAAGELLRRGLGQVEVVFAVNDVMAVGAMTYLRSAGVRLPRAQPERSR